MGTVNGDRLLFQSISTHCHFTMFDIMHPKAKGASMGVLELIERYESLPADKQGEVLDFVEFLTKQTQNATREKAGVSSPGKSVNFSDYPVSAFQGIDPVGYQRQMRDEW